MVYKQEAIGRFYDRALKLSSYRRYYEDTGYFNFGYWGGNARSQREASDALVDELVQRIAVKGGRILDVACGAGGTTKRLKESYAAENITAINISEIQLQAGRERLRGCSFLRMDATQLDFTEASFDAVICIEAAHHFRTRDRFFGEAFRVLKPGGSIVLTDMLFRAYLRPFAELGHVPAANFLPNTQCYQQRLYRIGFTEVCVEDATGACAGGFRKHLRGWAKSQYRNGRLKLAGAVTASILGEAIALYFAATCKTYLIASARKPINA